MASDNKYLELTTFQTLKSYSAFLLPQPSKIFQDIHLRISGVKLFESATWNMRFICEVCEITRLHCLHTGVPCSIEFFRTAITNIQTFICIYAEYLSRSSENLGIRFSYALFVR